MPSSCYIQYRVPFVNSPFRCSGKKRIINLNDNQGRFLTRSRKPSSPGQRTAWSHPAKARFSSNSQVQGRWGWVFVIRDKWQPQSIFGPV
ncbi:hypothetical protein PABG_12346 [Paracoccidioides brasiliensis Pb03]|nr:hypothetical protein PABG_12346 [Paracoccidioides brasiliensis Pb03]